MITLLSVFAILFVALMIYLRRDGFTWIGSIGVSALISSSITTMIAILMLISAITPLHWNIP